MIYSRSVERCHKETVATLLAAGADVLALNKFDKTPLDIACENLYEDIIHLLLKAKSEVIIMFLEINYYFFLFRVGVIIFLLLGSASQTYC